MVRLPHVVPRFGYPARHEPLLCLLRGRGSRAEIVPNSGRVQPRPARQACALHLGGPRLVLTQQGTPGHLFLLLSGGIAMWDLLVFAVSHPGVVTVFAAMMFLAGYIAARRALIRT